MMRRRKPRASEQEFWPVEGIDYPYPDRVQEALDLVERETLRIRYANCAHRFDSFRVRRNDDGIVIGKLWDCANCGFTKWEEQERWIRRTPIYGIPYERRSPYLEVPVSVQMKDPGRKAGAFESAMIRALERDLQRYQERT